MSERLRLITDRLTHEQWVGVATAAHLAVLAALVLDTTGAAIGAAVAATVAALAALRTRAVHLGPNELRALADAEAAVARSGPPESIARAIAEQARDLVDARAAVVLLERLDATVRGRAGDQADDVYRTGAEMRLLSDRGVPCGSIVVASRADGRAYSARDALVLDVLAERVSSTLGREALLAEMADERRQLTDIVHSSSDGIFSVGGDLLIRLWNPAMAAITGIARAEALGRPLAEVFRPVDAEGHAVRLVGHPGQREVRATRLVALDVGDEVRWLTCASAPMHDGGSVTVARDDTERKKVQDDKDGWVAQVSHELRTPLTPIKGFLDTLIRRSDRLSEQDRQQIYGVMAKEERRLEDLVDALLRSTQLDGAAFAVHVEPVDWPSCLHEQVASHRASAGAGAGAGERTLTVEAPDVVPPVSTDPGLAGGIVANLLSNAIKYGAGPIAVVVAVDGDAVVTRVVDHGPGIPRSDRERVFHKFTRLGDHLTRPQQGVGLGLSIARRSAERLGGTLWIEDTEGGGCTFALALPVATDQDSVIVTDSMRCTTVGDPAGVPSPSIAATTSMPSTT